MGPQGPHMGPMGPRGPHEAPGALLGPLGPQGPKRRAPEASGAIFGLRGGPGLAAAPSGLAAAPGGGPQPLFEVLAAASGGFFPAKMTLFRKK